MGVEVGGLAGVFGEWGFLWKSGVLGLKVNLSPEAHVPLPEEPLLSSTPHPTSCSKRRTFVCHPRGQLSPLPRGLPALYQGPPGPGQLCRVGRGGGFQEEDIKISPNLTSPQPLLIFYYPLPWDGCPHLWKGLQLGLESGESRQRGTLCPSFFRHVRKVGLKPGPQKKRCPLLVAPTGGPQGQMPT